jgi:hypothetical protein
LDFFYGILFSLHLGYENNYNGFNPYVGTYLTDNIAVGGYYNSEEKLSAYVAYMTEYLELGLVTGYTTAPVVPMVKFNYKNFFITPSLETIINENGTIHTPGIVFGFDWRM